MFSRQMQSMRYVYIEPDTKFQPLSSKLCFSELSIVYGDTFFKDLFRYPLAREGVYASSGRVCLAHARQKVSYIEGLKALQL